MTSVNFSESFLHMDVLCVENYLNYTLAGIGSSLFVYTDDRLQLSKKIFARERVHSIYVKNDLILLKGVKELALVSLQMNSELLSCLITCKIQCSDWIQELIFFDKNIIGLNTAHNFFELWDLKLKKCLKVRSCDEKCILYSCKIVGDTEENVVVFSGTVFGEVLIWAPFLKEEDSMLQRIKGHNGAVFSIEIKISEKILSTTSDDRSLKIWSITSENAIHYPLNWKGAKIQLIHTLFGHTARVWRSLIIQNFYLTIGEDSKLIIWSKDGRLLKSLALHQESGIRALHYSQKTSTIITGGEDGGINKISWKFLTSEIQPLQLFSLVQNFSTRLCFTNNGLVYTKSGGCVFISNSGKKVIYENENFDSYCCMEKMDDFIVLGSIKGFLAIIDTKKNVPIIEKQCLNGRIYSIHWLAKFLLTCGPEGRLNLWEFSNGFLEDKKVMTLPNCKERWTTCGEILNNNLIVGDRMGNLHIFDISLGGDPVQSFKKIHGYLGVTHIKNCGSTVFTVGRDGTIKTFNENLIHSLTYKLPMEWPWKIVNYKYDKLILGFHSVFFVIWSVKYREIIASHDCGGGHRSCDFKINSDKLSFLYLKEKKVFSVDIKLDEITRIKNGFHSKEINCIKVLSNYSEIIVSGGEDTTLRISQIKGSKLEEIEVLKTHTSSIKAISVCAKGSDQFLIVSAGGKGEIVIWSFDVTTQKCGEMINHQLRKDNQNWKSQIPDVDIRFMCIDVMKLENYFFMATGCSDCQIRIFSYSKDINLLCSMSYTHCVLNIAIVKIDFRLLVISMGTDGKVVFWDVTDYSKVLKLNSFCLHQSGINTFQFKEIEPKKFILVTGGDDNLLCISLVLIAEKKIELCKLWESSSTHYCQITGMKILKNFLLTTSVDQRIIVWKWFFNENEFKIEFLGEYMTAVPDIQGMDARWLDSSTVLVWVHGKGLDMLKVNVC